ncbi:Cysteine-rich secretory protein family protein [Filimonas lacunae]|uniref:Cysteine-rich secretory protein family protein n=2 Tax=Filimonas lacunae TaxID=477680 RepID=A0A1N7QXB5_9BACT|nr:Cysteine-rich secretory protein family protein [Filimonas lacunae]
MLYLLLCSCKKNTDAINSLFSKTDMLDAVNSIRNKGCRCGQDTMPPAPAVTWNDTLQKAADAHARDMYQRNYFSHITPEGTSPVQRVQAAGYTGQYVGENIARGYNNITAVIAGWLSSEAHCKAMMDTLYVQMGAGRADTYWVQEFGR